MKNRKFLIIIFEFVLSLMLLTTILTYVDLRSAIMHFSRFPVGIVFILVLCIAGLGVLQAVRWRTILAYLHYLERLNPMINLVFLSVGAMQITPGPIVADAIRSVGLVRLGVPLKVAMFSCLLDRIVALVALILIIAVSLPLMWIETARPIGPLIVSYIISLFIIVFVIAILREVKLPVSRGSKKLKVVLKVISRFWHFFYSGPVLIKVVGLSLIIHGVFILSVYVLFYQISSDVSLVYCLAFLPFVLLASMLPISFSGWGVREGTMVGFFSLVGVSSDISLSVSLAFGAINMAAGLLSFLLSRIFLRLHQS